MTDQMRAFAHEYVIDWNGKNAAIRAGYKETTAAVQACKLLSRPDVQAIIEQKMAKIERNTGIKAETVLEHTWGVATADVNDLVEFRRRCCRHCYGIDYGYQRTVQEMNSARRSWQKNFDACTTQQQINALGEFDEQGGIGFDARKPPIPDCTTCWGDGVGDAFFKPTASLSKEARALYAGVKQTKDGYQMLTVDKMAATEKLFKHFNLYKAEIKEQADALGDFLTAVQARAGKLPIKPQEAHEPAPAKPAGRRNWKAV